MDVTAVVSTEQLKTHLRCLQPALVQYSFLERPKRCRVDSNSVWSVIEKECVISDI